MVATGGLDALRAAAGGAARTAGDADAIAGVPARYVTAPESTDAVAAVLRAAAAQDLAIVVRGAGTKQDWAAPPRRLDIVLDLSRLAGVVEHVAGDLVAVVRAGTTLGELRDRLAPAGQQLAVDETVPGATVGGTVAAATSGPRRLLYGTVRDLLIGVTVVRADGVVARAGGKVVKNVAGYDLGKLVAGAYGTLAVITECAFRLHPLPAATAYVSRRVESPAAAGRLTAAVLGSQVVPSALEVDAPVGGGLELAVLLEGVPEGVAARAEATRRLLGADTAAVAGVPAWWAAYPWPPGGVGMKLTSALSGVPGLLAAAVDARRRHGADLAVRGSAGAGVLYAGLPTGTAPDVAARVVADLRAAAHAAGGHAVVLTAPAGARDGLDRWGEVPGLELMRRVKRQFDPEARLAPGRFVGGI
ncbi:MAG TPA: FAD-binding oxidoreductase [Pilimelia sp.]|nr:FAD-binding oxidoreductase [Pilimelia sp.]